MRRRYEHLPSRRELAVMRYARASMGEELAADDRAQARAREHRNLRLTWLGFSCAMLLFGCVGASDPDFAPQSMDVQSEGRRAIVRPKPAPKCTTYPWLCQPKEQEISI